MKSVLVMTALAPGSIAFALDGTINIHDPSTIVQCNGKFYTWGTGGSGLVSDDGRDLAPNGGGAKDFCARFLDADDKPLKDYTMSLSDSGKSSAGLNP